MSRDDQNMLVTNFATGMYGMLGTSALRAMGGRGNITIRTNQLCALSRGKVPRNSD
jgi:hypothetical protein